MIFFSEKNKVIIQIIFYNKISHINYDKNILY